MHLILKLFVLISLLNLSACANFFSGSKPLPLNFEERHLIKGVPMLINPPLLTLNYKDKNTKIYVVGFDGTNNDKDSFNQKVERKTLVGYLSEILKKNGHETKYYSGPGTQGSIDGIVDAAICFSCDDIAEKAIKELKNHIETKWNDIQNLEVRVFVLGFSRGAAIGKHFMNLLDDSFQTSLIKTEDKDLVPLVRSSGLLFDTVATSASDKLNLALSKSTDYLIHFTSQDEKRILFPLIRDFDVDFFLMPVGYSSLDFNTCPINDVQNSLRLVNIELPGSHSDIGASYSYGVGTYYRQLAEQTLTMFGLITKNNFKSEDYIFTEGKHNSDGMFDKVFGKTYEKRNRVYKTIHSNRLSDNEKEALKFRISAMTPQIGTSIKTTHTDKLPLVFDVQKSNEELRFVANHSMLTKTEHYYDLVNDTHSIIFDFPTASSEQTLQLPKSVWSSIPERKLSRLERIIVKNKDHSEVYFFVNCEFITSTKL
jgi:hypothetical protein